MTHQTIPARYRAAVLLTAVLSLVACAGDDTTADSAPAATAAAASDAAPTAAPVPGSAAPAPTAPASAAPAATTAAAAGGAVDVAGAELVCPAVLDTLALTTDAGWGPGAGRTDDAAKASISAQMVIALVLDDNDQSRALWDAVDAIAADGCPDEAAQLTAVYGSSTLLDILRAR